MRLLLCSSKVYNKMNSQYTILIADDHSIIRAGLNSLISSKPEYTVVAEADNGQEALAKALKHEPHLVLIDLSMPKANGTEAIQKIHKRLPDTKTLVITVHNTEEYVHSALKSGANGYILKDDSHDDLMVAIETVLAGKTYLSPSICANIVNSYIHNHNHEETNNSWGALTQREREILKLIAEGFKNKDIANYLSISLKTVEKHRSNLMKKLDIHSASNLTSYAINNGLV